MLPKNELELVKSKLFNKLKKLLLKNLYFFIKIRFKYDRTNYFIDNL